MAITFVPLLAQSLDDSDFLGRIRRHIEHCGCSKGSSAK